MKYYLVYREGVYMVRAASGFVPANSVEQISEEVPKSDFPYLRMREVEDPTDPEQMIQEMYLDEDLKAAGEAAATAKTLDLAWAQLRTERDRLLTACDFTQLEDAPLTAQEKTDYATYRQALRDLPDNVVDIFDITWPVKP